MLSWTAVALALLRSLPDLIALLKSVDERARSASDRQGGYDAAVADALARMQKAVESDAAADVETAEAHAAHPRDDDAFDREFERK